MIPWLVTVLGGCWTTALIGRLLVKARLARPTMMEATQWMITFALALAPFLKSVGPFGWFMAPSLVLHPVLNWGFLALFLLAVPIRSIFYLSHADAAIEDYSQGALDLGVDFTRWVDASVNGRRLRDVQASLRLRHPAVFRAAHIQSPITKGVLSPVVVLPLAWIPDDAAGPRGRELRGNLGITEHVEAGDVFAAILHELSHHQSRDPHRALLRLGVAIVLPLEWTLSNSDNARFSLVRLGLVERALHWVFTVTRWPAQSLVQAAWAYQESRADEGAFRFDSKALERLNALRGGVAAWDKEAGRAQASRNTSWVVSFLMVGIGAVVVALAPGRPLMGLAMGGDGGIIGLQPRGWSINTLENKYGQRPSLFYRPPTRQHPSQVEYLAARDEFPLDSRSDSPQGVMFYTRAYPSQPIEGPARYRIIWEFWRHADPVNLPIFPVFLFLRPVETAAVSSDPRVLTYFSSNPKDYRLEDLGAGHYRATWTAEIPQGRKAEYFSVEWRAILPGKVVLNSPVLEQLR